MTTPEQREIIRRLFEHWNDSPPQQEPPLVLSFDRFHKGNYNEGERNLYIVWRGKQALYIGISQRGIYDRWFTMIGHHWNNSTIALVIARNHPASMRWKIELRHVITDLHKEERRLIAELRPLFNGMHAPQLTPEQIKLKHILEGTFF